MQLYVSPIGYTTSLSVSPYFATLVEENELAYTFEISFSILQSEIFQKSLNKLVINVINPSVIKNEVTGLQSLSNPEFISGNVNDDAGLFEIQNLLLKNFSQISAAKSKTNSIIATKSINLQSYINTNALVDFSSKKKIEEISSLCKFVSTLELENQTIQYPSSNLSKLDIQKLNHQLITQFLIDPSDIVSKNFKISNNPITENIRFFYLFDALSSLQSKNSYYKSVKKTKLVDKVYIKTNVELSKKLLSDTVEVEFEVYESNNSFPIQRVKRQINVSKHVKFARVENKVPGLEHSNEVLITTQNSDLDSYSIKVKEINNAGHCTPYSEIIQEKNPNSIEKERTYKRNVDYSFKESRSTSRSRESSRNKSQFLKKVNPTPSNKISIYRCSFKDSSSEYSNPFFKNVVVGNRLDLDPTGLVIESNPNSPSAILKIINPPYYATQFQISRKQLFQGGGSTLPVVVSHFNDISNFVSTFVDSTVQEGQTYEYSIKYKTFQGTVKNSISQIYKHVGSALLSTISTEFSEPSISKVNGSIEVRATIKVIFNPDAAAKLREILSISNTLAYYSTEVQSIDDTFKNLFHHKITRVNLKTGQRETFENMQMQTFGTGDMFFQDSIESRRNNAISEIDPMTNYRYEVRTFLKDPTSMLRDRVENVVSSPIADTGKTRNYFYRPYKWRQPSTLSSGMILAQDNRNNIITRPFLDEGEIGVTSSFTLTNASKNFDVNFLIAERIDLRKIKVSWSINENLTEYDHFILIKEVNKERNFIGAVMSLDYIDTLMNEESGTIVYYVIPVLRDYSLANATSSNELIIDPEELL